MEKVLEGFVEKSEWEQEKRYGVRLFTIRRFKGHETAYQRSRYGVSIKLIKKGLKAMLKTESSSLPFLDIKLPGQDATF